MVNVLTIDAVIHDFLNEHLLDAVVVRRCFCKKGVLKKKETLLQEFEFHETFKDIILNRTPPVVASGLFSSLYFISKPQDCKNFIKLVASDFFLGFRKLNTKAVARMCSIKKLFLEISGNSQKNICARKYFLIKLQPLGLLIVLLNSIAHAVLY